MKTLTQAAEAIEWPVQHVPEKVTLLAGVFKRACSKNARLVQPFLAFTGCRCCLLNGFNYSRKCCCWIAETAVIGSCQSIFEGFFGAKLML